MKSTPLDPSFALKIAPPSVRGVALPAAWLSRLFERMRGRRVTVIRAPAGYGKTTLMASWRRDALNARAFAAWLMLDDRDDRARLVRGLIASLRDAIGNPQFGGPALDAAKLAGDELNAMTFLLAGIAEVARPVVLFLDDVHRLPEDTQHSLLTYLLLNLPSNLQVVMGTRQATGLTHGELAARGEYVGIGVDEMRMRVEESIAFLRARCSGRVDADACARFHDLADGWPIALQLIVAVLERDPSLDPAAIGGSSEDVERFFSETLLDRLPAPDAELLVTMSILDAIHPELVAAMTGTADVAALLRRLQDATPILASSENSAWLRMHPLARRAIGGRFATLPEARRRELHWRAGSWLHDAGHAEAAARHALAAGRADAAHAWIGNELHALSFAGRFGEVLGWAERMPADVLATPAARLAIAWAQALSYQFAAAEESVACIGAMADPEVRYEADLILAARALWADDFGRADVLLRRWGDGLSAADARVRQAHLNIVSYMLVGRGDGARARYVQQQARNSPVNDAPDVASYFVNLVLGLSHLWDAQPTLAAQAVRAPLERAEASGGRRSVAACFLAATLGAALWGQDRRADAESVLAHRLDIVERTAPPEVVALIYETQARIARLDGDEPRAIELLQRLQVIGEERHLPRLELLSLLAQIRLNAAARRTRGLTPLAGRLATVWKHVPPDAAPSQISFFDLLRRLGQAHVEIASHDADAARKTLAGAETLASGLNHVPYLLECRLLLALTTKARDRDADEILRETLSLAEANGFVRVFADVHPAVIDRVRAFAEGQEATELGASLGFIARVVGGAAAVAPAVASARPVPSKPQGAALALLTPKEAQMLEYLAQGMTNKEIARALGIGTETIKWHLKNLFAKLSAGSRRHAVDRARMLGLI